MTAKRGSDHRRIEGEADGRAAMDRARRALGADRAAAAQARAPLPLAGPPAPARPAGALRHPLRAAQRHRLGSPAAAARLRQRDHLLATARRMAAGRGLGEAARPAARPPAGGRCDRLLAGGRRFQPDPGQKGGAATGPSPVDRGRPGSKHHLLVDANGIPLAYLLTGGKRNDITGVAAAARRDAAPARPRRPAAQAAAQAARRPWLWPRRLPAQAAGERHQAADCPARNTS